MAGVQAEHQAAGAARLTAATARADERARFGELPEVAVPTIGG
ncbi:MAG: hypothetical protein ACRDY2_00925 [Acidimicrobiales bacterium]